MKKIGIDMRLYSQTGVGVYLRNLLHELLSLIPEDVDMYVYMLPQDLSLVRPHPRVQLREAPYKWHSFSEQVGMLNTVKNDHLDLMHFTYFGYPILYRGRFIATVHDVTPLLFRTGKASTRNPFIYHLKFRAFKHILKTQVKGASAIITPSMTVKEQISGIFGPDIGKKTTVIYEGVNYELRDSKEDEKLYQKYTKPYLLYVGNFYPHKNLENLISAYGKLKTSIPLLLVGPDDFFAQRIRERIHSLGKNLHVFFHHNPTLNELNFIYRHAVAFLHPTLSEGFGLPLIEAAFFGTPIIASDIPVIRELLGSSYIPFDARDPGNMAEKINSFIAHPFQPDYREILKKYSFAAMAKETLRLYLDNL